MTHTDLAAFIDTHWSGDEDRWLRALGEAGLIGIDWPQTDWPRTRQLEFAELLAAARCPVMPESISVIAPVVIAHASHEVQARVLAMIQDQPNTRAIELITQDDNLVLRTHEESLAIGEPGDAPRILAFSFSPFCMLLEIILGAAHCRDTLAFWRESSDRPSDKSLQDKSLQDKALQDKSLQDLEVRLETLRALFLRGSHNADSQLAVLAGELRQDCFWLLNGALGYYSLLDPDPQLSSNEPLPFVAERRYLRSLRLATDRDERLQRDQLFKELNHENA